MTIEKLKEENEQLRALLGATLRDADRLDWLEKTAFMAYRQRDPEDGELYAHFTVVNEDAESRRGCVQPSLRAAIDQARGANTTNDQAASH